MDDLVLPTIESPDFGGERGHAINPLIFMERDDTPERVWCFARLWELLQQHGGCKREADLAMLLQTRMVIRADDAAALGRADAG